MVIKMKSNWEEGIYENAQLFDGDQRPSFTDTKNIGERTDVEVKRPV